MNPFFRVALGALASCCFVLAGCGGGGNNASSKTCTTTIAISDAAGLQAIANNLAGCYTLKNNIDLSGVSNFAPIGSVNGSFTGTLDGAGFTISGLTINQPTMENVGLFGAITGQVKNLTVDHKGITGQSMVGAIAGQLMDGASVTGVIVKSASGDAINSTNIAGGVAGAVTTGATVTVNARVSSNVQEAGGWGAGGLVGLFGGSGSVIGVMTGSVTVTAGTAASRAGGLVGDLASNATVIGYTTGSVTNLGAGPVGGLVGKLVGGGKVIGYATGAVTGKANAGGLVGITYSASSGGSATGFAKGVISTTAANSTYGLAPTSGSSYSFAGYWDIAQTPSVVAVSGVTGLNTANIVCSATSCVDNNGTSNVATFNNATFVSYFDLPLNQTSKWPKLKQQLTVGSTTYSLSSADYTYQTTALGW